ncbi:bifunctional DedA family/phosphatase PAP2 family protein [Halomonas ramblicola]|uniref:bifunctional DedA family/phosphatase PAP2 family protein n=1 Tax=Halomonas ramblicola TaxID=747349 RepID=UPI0025B30194|nr:bifunctional DedA family/phosphatase PAP2 family protein [Halomonas ramblicola]MDN3520568.1 bifunctional DedA family/phosphatase PAP2 family protein [Halomonas ramblicola]
MNLADALYQLTPSPGLLLLIIAAISLVESLALVGVLVPGVLLITVAASMAGHQELALPATLIAAFAGAVIGDGASFLLGYTQHERVTRRWPLSRHPEWLARGARFFQRYGTLSVFLGRFVGPVRPIVPLIAGMLRMSPRDFTWANLASAALWAPAYVLPGYLLGRTWQQLLDVPPELQQLLAMLVMGLLALAVTFSWLRHHVGRGGRVYRQMAGLARRHPLLRNAWLRQSGNGEVPLASLLLLILSLGGLSGWTLLVMQHGAEGPLRLDRQVHTLLAAWSFPGLDALGQALARAGDLLGVLALSLPWAAWLLWRQRHDALFHLGAGLGGIALLNTLGKALFGRPRPDTPAYLADSLAYPSAHTSTAVVVFGLAAAFTARELSPGHRHWVFWLAILAATLMALSRLTLGVHWFSDLVGGALLGLVVCALVLLAWQQKDRASLAPCPWPWLGLASLALVATRVAWLPPV